MILAELESFTCSIEIENFNTANKIKEITQEFHPPFYILNS